MNLLERSMKVGDAIAKLDYDKSEREKYTDSERRAAQLLAGVVGVMPEEIVFLNAAQLEEMLDQLAKDFDGCFELVTLRSDDSVVFFYGKSREKLEDGCKDGLWCFSKCHHCGAPSMHGKHIHDFYDIRWASSYGGPWWHRAGCNIITPSVPCH